VARVSILLTCFNHLRHLPEAVAGIERQTYTDLEVIAIDDGSTDGTREWLEQCPLPMQRILNETNLGTYGSLNRALAQARGDYVAILNDDDVWEPEKLARQVETLESDPQIGIVHTGGDFIDDAGQPLHGAPLGFEYPRFESGDILERLVYQNQFITSAVLVRREALDLFNDSYFGTGDWEMWLRICERWSAAFVPETLTHYRVHAGSASRNMTRIYQDDQRLREWIASRESVYRERTAPWQTAFREPNSLDRAMAHNAAALGVVRQLNGDRPGARRALADSIRRMPTRLKTYARWLATFLP